MSMALYFAIHLYAAIGLGAMVGIERQWRKRLVGLRTTSLVSAGACAFALSGFLITGDSSARGRIVSYVISGVGFLGAGVIFRDGTNVRGLDTAGTVWCSAAIGVLTGLGSSVCAAILATSVIVINVFLRPLSIWLNTHRPDDADLETELGTCSILVEPDRRPDSVSETVY